MRVATILSPNLGQCKCWMLFSRRANMAHVSQEISPSGPALHLKGRCHIAHERVTAGTAGSRTAGPLDGVRVIYCGGWMIVGVSVLSAWWLTIADIADIISPPHQQPNPAWMRRDVDAGFSRFSLSISLSLSLSLSLSRARGSATKISGPPPSSEYGTYATAKARLWPWF